MSIHALFLLLYLVALIAVGALKAGKIKTQEDFSLAGRGLLTWVLIGTLLATWIGTGSIFGNAGETYRRGLGAVLLPVGSVAGILVLFTLARRIRTFGQFTIQDILEARFGVVARLLGTATLLSAYVIIVSYQYRAGAAVLSRVWPALDITTATIAVAAFVILYTALAGMFSVAYTDVANGILMSLGLLCALPILLDKAGGFETAVAALELPSQRSLFAGWEWAALMGATLPAFLLVLGDANMYQRFFSARDAKSARRSAWWMLIGVLVLEVVIIVVALLGLSLVAQGKLDAPTNAGHIIIHAAFDPTILPPVLGALLVATVVAVVVSTADSYLLAPSTSVVRDLYQRFVNADASPAHMVLVGRVVVVGLGLFALGLSFLSDKFFSVALFAYTIYGCGITPAIMAAFFWPRATSAGAVASILVGGLTGLAWEAIPFFGNAEQFDLPLFQSLAESLPVDRFAAVLIALPLSVAALVVVSFLTPAPPESAPRVI